MHRHDEPALKNVPSYISNVLLPVYCIISLKQSHPQTPPWLKHLYIWGIVGLLPFTDCCVGVKLE